MGEQTEATWGVAGVALRGVGDIASGLLLACWRAPLLAAAAGWVLADAAAWTGRAWVPAVLLLVLPLLVGGIVWWQRPGWLAWLRTVAVGQWWRVAVYRPRWHIACEAAGAMPRLGGRRHCPRLVRHRRHGSRDVLLVRMAPGQTVAQWQTWCPALASTLTAYSVTARAHHRPGWVALDVLRRDPLAGESTAVDPARQPTSGPVALGCTEHGDVFKLDPYSTPHAGIQGSTRSGKSALCYTLLAALAHRQDVVVCGVDPTGILLGPHRAGRGARYIATGTSAADLDDALRVLDDVVRLMEERIADLLAHGLDKVATYSPSLPVVWVVLEEWPGLLSAARALDLERKGAKDAPKVAPAIEARVGRLIKEGAKVGCCVLVLAQRMSGGAIDTDDRMNLGQRITLRVDNSDAVTMLHEGVARDVVTGVRTYLPGVALAEAPGVPLARARMHYTDYATYRARVAAGIEAHPGSLPLGVDVVGEVVTLPETTQPAA